jgi:hypothetical protein
LQKRSAGVTFFFSQYLVGTGNFKQTHPAHPPMQQHRGEERDIPTNAGGGRHAKIERATKEKGKMIPELAIASDMPFYFKGPFIFPRDSPSWAQSERFFSLSDRGPRCGVDTCR